MMTSQKTARLCAVCGGRSGQKLHHQRFVLPAGHPLGDGYDVVTCATCGFAFADTAVPQSAYDEFYARLSKYDDAAISTGGGANASDAARLQETARTIAAHLPVHARVLDIGCAGGGLLHELKKMGFTDLVGLDPSAACVHYGAREFGLEMHQGTFAQMPALGRFDCVVLSHVLEHVEDVGAALRSVRALLRDEGALYVEVPDAPRYGECLVAPFQDFNTEHINHFSARSLENLAARNGFKVEDGASKTIEATAGVPYPALWQWWRKSEASNLVEGSTVEFDRTLRPALESYVAASQKMLDAMNETLRPALQGEVVVWGTGQLALKLLAETVLGQARIAFFVDANPVFHATLLHGAPVRPPEALRETQAPIVIATTIHRDAIVRRIRDEMKLDNLLISLM